MSDTSPTSTSSATTPSPQLRDRALFPIAFWGIGVVMNVWDVWRGDDFTEEQIRDEIARIQHS